MSIIKLNDLEQQIKNVIPLLEKQYQKTPTQMLKLIISRYKKAEELIVRKSEGIDPSQIHILGGVRGYLDSASDYMNPMLGEMQIAEKLFAEIFGNK